MLFVVTYSRVSRTDTLTLTWCVRNAISGSIVVKVTSGTVANMFRMFLFYVRLAFTRVRIGLMVVTVGCRPSDIRKTKVIYNLAEDWLHVSTPCPEPTLPLPLSLSLPIVALMGCVVFRPLSLTPKSTECTEVTADVPDMCAYSAPGTDEVPLDPAYY